jgi:hypothetical protein
MSKGVIRAFKTGHGYHIIGYNVGKTDEAVKVMRLNLGDDIGRIEFDERKPKEIRQTLFKYKNYFNGEDNYYSIEIEMHSPLKESEYEEYGFSMFDVIGIGGEMF